MRDPKRIPEVLEAVRKAWEQVPDWRLGQLICNVGRQLGHFDPFYLEDEDLVNFLTQAQQEEQ